MNREQEIAFEEAAYEIAMRLVQELDVRQGDFQKVADDFGVDYEVVQGAVCDFCCEYEGEMAERERGYYDR